MSTGQKFRIVMALLPLLFLGTVHAICSVIAGREYTPQWVECAGDKVLSWAFDK